MIVINARNVHGALAQGILALKNIGDVVPSRNGETIEIPFPATTVYLRPWERVLINEDRDANPFFHFFESLWMLAGRQDVKFLSEFNSNMKNYSDDGVTFNAAYGYRARQSSSFYIQDQLTDIIRILTEDSNSRQAVCQLWDPKDLTKGTKDKACNMSIVFRIRNNKLDMTVYNRSNDMIWGAYGANAVHFSMFQEYVAAHIGVDMGTYTQVSNAFHVYTEGTAGALWDKMKSKRAIPDYYESGYVDLVRMDPTEMDKFDYDLGTFFKIYDMHGIAEINEMDSWESSYFKRLVLPMLGLWTVYKNHGPEEAIKYGLVAIQAEDWRCGCKIWLQKRAELRAVRALNK